MRFQNPANGHIEEFGEATWLWVLVGGPIYFAYKQDWADYALGRRAGNMTVGHSAGGAVSTRDVN